MYIHDYAAQLTGLSSHAVAGQAECVGCRQIMVFPLRSSYLSPVLQCTVCSCYTRVPPAYYYNCRGCGLYLTYSATIATVMCAVCNTVYPPLDSVVYATLAPLTIADTNGPSPIPHTPPILPPRGFNLLPSTPVRPVPGPGAPPLPRVNVPQRYPLPSQTVPATAHAQPYFQQHPQQHAQTHPHTHSQAPAHAPMAERRSSLGRTSLPTATNSDNTHQAQHSASENGHTREGEAKATANLADNRNSKIQNDESNNTSQ